MKESSSTDKAIFVSRVRANFVVEAPELNMPLPVDFTHRLFDRRLTLGDFTLYAA